VFVFGDDVVGYESTLANADLTSRAALNQAITYDIYIINPDGTKRSAFSEWATITKTERETYVYGIEDKGSDMDHNDVVIDLDPRNCLEVRVSVRPLEAAWHHQIGLAIYYEGELKTDVILWTDSHEAVGQDALINLSELDFNLNPVDIVEDGDGMSDDIDHDGLSTAEEVLYGTDPVHPDTDRDGYPDGIEIENGFDPREPAIKET